MNSDFCASVPFIENKLKILLLSKQAQGDEIEWVREKHLNSKLIFSPIIILYDTIVNKASWVNQFEF